MAKKENSFSGWLQRVRKTGEFSDVTVVIDEEETFHLHMLPLLNASSFFRNLPNSSKGSYDAENPRIVEIRNLPGGAQGFCVAADFCYLIKPTFTLENVARIRAVAEYLGMLELLDSSKKFLYLNIFSHWRSSIAFLQQYKRLLSPVDDYIETRCLKVIAAACIKAFFDTKYLSGPVPFSNNLCNSNAWQSSPCQILTDVLVATASLPDHYVQEVIDELVDGEVNLNLKCRQGRNVKGWLDATIKAECTTDREKCWVAIWLTRMLEKSVTSDRPWLELSSQYWCSLLEHVGDLMKKSDSAMLERLHPAKAFLELRIGGSLHELDDYLPNYHFDPCTLLSIVGHFKELAAGLEVGEKEMEEVVMEIDSCIWKFVEGASIGAREFIFFIEAFPASARSSHDLLYSAVEKLVATKGTDFCNEEKQNLWGLVDIAKLSPSHSEKALNNAAFLCQPHVLEHVLQQHSQELSKVDDDQEGRNLGRVMQKVLRASLKLLEENSRRSKEIMELQKQYAALMGTGKSICLLENTTDNSCCESSPDTIAMLNKARMHTQIDDCEMHAIIPDEVEEAPSDTPTHHSSGSSGDYCIHHQLYEFS